MPKRSKKKDETADSPIVTGNDDANLEKAILEREAHSDGFLVVGIGASAGGIEALSQFFAHVPADGGIAYVVILHLSPDHDSRLDHVLQQVTPLPVSQVARRTRVEPNHVYVVPPDKSLSITDRSIEVKPIKTVEERRAPVDIFFRTLADTHGSNAVGVILSGTGANGSMGLKRIKERGGVTFVQNPREAQFNEMPRNAIATELVDMILPVADIPGHIIRYRDNTGSVRIIDDFKVRPEEQQNALRDIFAQLRIRTGHDFSNYKRPTMLRRIERRISVRNLPDIEAYSRYLREDPAEANALLKDLLISVTNFFRDKKAFQALEKEIFPRLISGAFPGKPVRIWVAGCATGEEAYSIAMIAAEHTSGGIHGPPVQIFATDIDEQAIAIAREGVYTLNDAADVSPERLRRFFVPEGGNYRIRREIREMILFANHNLIKDPPFSHLDLVTCRNLLIYLNHAVQGRVMETLHFALKPGGYLFLGSSESVDGSSDLFKTVDKQHHIFQSREVSVRAFPVPESVPIYRSSVRVPAIAEKKTDGPDRLSYKDLHLKLIEEFAPPSIVINQDYEILHISESAGKYLIVAGGEPTNNLLRLVRRDIRLDLRTALFQSVQQQSNVEVKGIKVGIDGHEESINLLVRPVTAHSDTAQGFIVVVFEPARTDDGGASAQYAPPEPVARQLEEELMRSRTQLQSALEQSEIQAEELRASNEELQAMNEELRSSAEELETSKEELQSINEELTTVNQELKIKIDELSHTNNNFTNLLSSIDIAVVFLDRSLRVNLFSPAAVRIFNLIQGDVGRPLSDITSNLEYGDLAKDAEQVLEKLQAVENEVCTTDGRIYQMQIFPYRTVEDRINGVVVTFVDITQRKQYERELAASEEQFRRAIEDAPIPVIMHAEDGEVLQISRTWTKLTGYELIDVPTFDAWLTRAYGDGAEGVRAHMHELFEGNQGAIDVEFPVRTKVGGLRHWSFSASSPGTLRDGRRFIVGMAVDITERKRAEEVRRFNTLLLDTVEQSVIATDMEGKITFWNKYAEALFGWTAKEVIGRSVIEITTPNTSSEQAEEVMSELRKGKSWSGEFNLQRRDGTTFPAYVSNTPIFDDEGHLTGVVGLSEDITQRKQGEAALRGSEERLRLLMDSFTDIALFTTDTEGIVTAWNPGAEKMFGFTADEIVDKKSADIVFTPEDRENGVPDKERKTAVRKGKALDERWHIRKNGERFFASGFMVPLTDGEQLIGYGKFASDLTERKMYEDQLKEAREGLEKRVAERTHELAESNASLRKEIADRRRAEEERIDLLRKIVTTQEDERRRIARDLHDQLGQQLTALRLRLNSLLQECDDVKMCGDIEQIQSTAAQIDKDVDFLAWELRPAALDDLGLRATLSNFVKAWESYTGIKCEYHTSGLRRTQLPFDVETNLYRIAQEALNNVHKHAQAKNISVLLEKQRDTVVLIVEDDGKGFNPSSKKSRSKGLGLVGMKERAQMCGGTLEIESSPGSGTTIYVKVPANKSEPPA